MKWIINLVISLPTVVCPQTVRWIFSTRIYHWGFKLAAEHIQGCHATFSSSQFRHQRDLLWHYAMQHG